MVKTATELMLFLTEKEFVESFDRVFQWFDIVNYLKLRVGQFH
jgi:hypothetical protein